MTKPLALISYENLLPGTQLVNRLQDLGYRVRATPSANLVDEAEREKPLVAVVDLSSRRANMNEAIANLKKNAETRHIPILAYSSDRDGKAQVAAKATGADMVASEAGILDQLPQLLDQVLQVD